MLVNSTFDKTIKESPLILVEVGARGGLSMYWKTYEPYVATIGFEPDPCSFDKLKLSDRHRVFSVGLHNKSGKVILYQTKKEGVSSILRPNHQFLRQFPIADEF